MTDAYDLIPDLVKMIEAALFGRHDTVMYGERIAADLGLGECDSPEVIEAELRKALGIPGPRTVTYDLTDKDAWLALDTALEDFSVAQRDRARGEGGNPRRHEWADVADRMRAEATAARAAGWQEVPGGG